MSGIYVRKEDFQLPVKEKKNNFFYFSHKRRKSLRVLWTRIQLLLKIKTNRLQKVINPAKSGNKKKRDDSPGSSVFPFRSSANERTG